MNKKLSTLAASLITTLALAGHAYATDAVVAPNPEPTVTAAPSEVASPTPAAHATKPAAHHTKQTVSKKPVHKAAMKPAKATKKPVSKKPKKMAHKPMHTKTAPAKKPSTDAKTSVQTGAQAPKK